MARGGARLRGRFDTVVFAGCVILALVASALPASMRDPIASSLRRTIVAPLVGMQRSAERWRAAWLESEAKTLQRDSLALEFSKARALGVENDRLRRLMGLGSRLAWGFIPAEALHTSGQAEDVITTLTLTAGSRAGASQYSPVVAPEGVVGMIQTVDPRLSIAILYSHPDFRVSAMSADGAAFGIVYPHLGVGPSEIVDRYLLELRNVPFRDTLKLGTPIFSSGLGGAWPRGIVIGTIVHDLTDPEEGWSRTYLVRPAVNPAHVTSVMILTPQRASQGVGNVWADAAQAQTALRSIVASGDSIARQAASAEAVVRRAALDSIRRGSGTVARPRDTTRAAVPPAPAVPARPDTTRRDTTQPDTTRVDTTRRDTLRTRP